MRNSSRTQSTTSLPRDARDEVSSRSLKYLLLMSIRIVCFIAMVLITPYGWYTWVLGAAAVFLPYIAVVLANVGEDGDRAVRQDPERAIEATPSAPPPTAAPNVLRIEETRRIEPPQDGA